MDITESQEPADPIRGTRSRGWGLDNTDNDTFCAVCGIPLAVDVRTISKCSRAYDLTRHLSRLQHCESRKTNTTGAKTLLLFVRHLSKAEKISKHHLAI